MIAATYLGWQPAGLLAYLLGPGRHEDHHRPRVVAGSEPVSALQPPRTGPGEFDVDLRALTAMFEHPARMAGLPTRPPAAGTPLEGRQGYVWHTAVRLHPQDPTLTDAQWAQVAERIMTRTGISLAGCPWIAVRHADDHIHLMADLIQQRGEGYRRVHPRYWKLRMREACRELEREFGLRVTAPADHTADIACSPGEQRKAARTGQAPARVALRRAVADAAATATSGAEFAWGVAERGVQLRWNTGPDGGVRGYAVALPGDTTGHGRPIWYAGGRLARELSWPKLLDRWAGVPALGPLEPGTHARVSPAARRAVLGEATAIAAAAARELRAGGDRAGIASGAAELAHVLAMTAEYAGPGPLTRAAAAIGAAGRMSGRVVLSPDQLSPTARALRGAAHQLGALTMFSRQAREQAGAALLVLALAELVAEVGAWRRTQHGHEHQARAAAHGHRLLRHTIPDRAPAPSPVTQEVPRAQPRPRAARPTTTPAAVHTRQQRRPAPRSRS